MAGTGCFFRLPFRDFSPDSACRWLVATGGSFQELPRRTSESSTATEWVDNSATDVSWRAIHLVLSAVKQSMEI